MVSRQFNLLFHATLPLPGAGMRFAVRSLRPLFFAAVSTLLLSSGQSSASAQETTAAGQPPSALLGGLEWRDVGPMRGGRAYAVAGVASQPDTFYMGSVGGGVWKTENAGRTWFPIADDQRHSHRLYWSHRRRPLGPQHRLRRHRRARHPQPALLRHRRLQIH